MLVCLNIGCGLRKKEGHIGVDIVKVEGIGVVARVENLPFKINSVDKIYTRHTLEHVSDFERAIKEMWRVCKPNAIVEIIVPFWAHSSAHNDPLHKRFFGYFSFDNYSIQKVDKTYIPNNAVKFYIEDRKYIFPRRRVPFSLLDALLEWFANKHYNTYESALANIFPAYEIYFKLRVVK
ncbi:MAG: class I SAM-dependent methyltransferase [Methanosarcinales archaeon]|nr:MAG: class I SAM-dependent methyltransferase [Methanosarcinales archaeon]